METVLSASTRVARKCVRQMPRDLWRFDLSVEGVADLSDIDRSATVGLRALGTTRASPGGMLTSGISYVSRVYPLH